MNIWALFSGYHNRAMLHTFIQDWRRFFTCIRSLQSRCQLS